MAYIGKSPDGTGVRSRFYYTQTSGGGTSVSGSSDDGTSLAFSDGAYVDVFLNGVLLVAGTDYNTTTANTIAGLAALANGDVVEVVVYDIFTVADAVSSLNGGTFSGAVGFSGGITGDVAFDTNTLKVDSSNNRVGIGTAAPNKILHLETSGETVQRMVASTTNLAGFYFGDSGNGSIGQLIYDNSSDAMRFNTNGSERMRIKSDGEVNIGGGSDSFTEAHLNVYNNGGTSNGWGGAALTVYGPYGGGISFVDSGSNPADGDNGYKMHTVDGGNDFYIRGTTSKTASSGGVYLNNFATSWSSASDERQKENIVNITGALDDVATLRAVKANYIWSDTTRAFLIAQDVQAVLPEAVSIQNKEAEEAEQRLGIDYYQVVPLLVAALKEAKTKIETLETKVAALEAAE